MIIIQALLDVCGLCHCVNVRRPVAKKLVTIKDQLYGQVAQSHRAAVVKKMESLKIILFLGLAGTASGS